MATLVDATCSECFVPQVIELNPRRTEIACEFCSHSVPMFEKRDMDGVRAALKQERSKMYIALAAFAGAVALFTIHVLTNSRDDVIQITSSDGVDYTGHLDERTDSYVRIIDEDTEDLIKVDFKEALADKVKAKMADFPAMTEDVAVAMVGDENIAVLSQEPGQIIFLVLAGVAALAALVFSAIATQDKLICEF